MEENYRIPIFGTLSRAALRRLPEWVSSRRPEIAAIRKRPSASLRRPGHAIPDDVNVFTKRTHRALGVPSGTGKSRRGSAHQGHVQKRPDIPKPTNHA